MNIALHVRHPLLLSDINETLIFSKNTLIPNFMKIRFVPCRRTDMSKLIVAFRNSANESKNHPYLELKLKKK